MALGGWGQASAIRAPRAAAWLRLFQLPAARMVGAPIRPAPYVCEGVDLLSSGGPE